MKIIEKIESLCENPLIDNGLEIIDIEFKKEGNNKVLRIYVEKIEGRVNLDEISNITRVISDLLDKEDLIEEEYVLEVSSPGVNRVIKKEKDFLKFSGEKVDVALYKKIAQGKKFIAILKGYEDGNVLLEVDDELITIPYTDISKVNLHFEFK